MFRISYNIDNKLHMLTNILLLTMTHADCIMRLQSHYDQYWKLAHMANLNRFEPFRGTPTLHEQLNRMFGEGFNRQEESNLTTWAPAVDIMETEHD